MPEPSFTLWHIQVLFESLSVRLFNWLLPALEWVSAVWAYRSSLSPGGTAWFSFLRSWQCEGGFCVYIYIYIIVIIIIMIILFGTTFYSNPLWQHKGHWHLPRVLVPPAIGRMWKGVKNGLNRVCFFVFSQMCLRVCVKIANYRWWSWSTIQLCVYSGQSGYNLSIIELTASF